MQLSLSQQIMLPISFFTLVLHIIYLVYIYFEMFFRSTLNMLLTQLQHFLLMIGSINILTVTLCTEILIEMVLKMT